MMEHDGAAIRSPMYAVREGQGRLDDDDVVREVHLRIDAAAPATSLAVLACSPRDLEELVTGFLFTAGLIEAHSDLRSLLIEHPDGRRGSRAVATVRLDADESAARFDRLLPAARFVASGCGASPLGALTPPGARPTRQALPADAMPPRAWIDTALVSELAHALQHCSPLFAATGGVHAAALAGPLPNSGSLLVVREDIGRHNAVDKVAGWCLRHGMDTSDKALLVTGRLSAEIALKAARLGVPLVVSRAAPTRLGIEVADAAGTTLVGFARGARFNVYCNWWRIRAKNPGPAAAPTSPE